MNGLQKKLKNPYLLKFFLMAKMPMGFFSGMRVEEISDNKSIVKLPFGRINLNPFKSMYFGSQCIASEFSTGTLVLSAIENAPHSYSMLVKEMRATFEKRGLSAVRFVCQTDPGFIENILKQSAETGEGYTFDLISTGFSEEGEVISQFVYTWTIRVKQKK